MAALTLAEQQLIDTLFQKLLSLTGYRPDSLPDSVAAPLAGNFPGPITPQNGQLQAASPNTLSLIGNVPNTGSAPGIIVDNITGLTSTLRPMLSLRSGGTERAAVYFNGASSTVAADQFSSYNAILFSLLSSVNDGATAIGFLFNTGNTLANATAKLASWQNGNVEQLAIQRNGALIFSGASGTTNRINLAATDTLGIGSGMALTQDSVIFGSTNGVSGRIANNVADGATAVGVITDTQATFVTAGAKILSVRTGGVEKLAVDKNSKFVIPTGGAAPVVGQVTLVAGVATVSTTAVAAGSLIFLSRAVLGAGVLGTLSYTISAGVSFTINTGTTTEVSTVNWWIVN